MSQKWKIDVESGFGSQIMLEMSSPKVTIEARVSLARKERVNVKRKEEEGCNVNVIFKGLIFFFNLRLSDNF